MPVRHASLACQIFGICQFVPVGGHWHAACQSACRVPRAACRMPRAKPSVCWFLYWHSRRENSRRPARADHLRSKRFLLPRVRREISTTSSATEPEDSCRCPDNVTARQEADGSLQRTSEISREAPGLRLVRQDQRSGACIFFCSCSTTSSAEERRRLQEQVYVSEDFARPRLCLSSPRERRVFRSSSVAAIGAG